MRQPSFAIEGVDKDGTAAADGKADSEAQMWRQKFEAAQQGEKEAKQMVLRLRDALAQMSADEVTGSIFDNLSAHTDGERRGARSNREGGVGNVSGEARL